MSSSSAQTKDGLEEDGCVFDFDCNGSMTKYTTVGEPDLEEIKFALEHLDNPPKLMAIENIGAEQLSL